MKSMITNNNKTDDFRHKVKNFVEDTKDVIQATAGRWKDTMERVKEHLNSRTSDFLNVNNHPDKNSTIVPQYSPQAHGVSFLRGFGLFLGDLGDWLSGEGSNEVNIAHNDRIQGKIREWGGQRGKATGLGYLSGLGLLATAVSSAIEAPAVNHQRKETALKEFEHQQLSWFTSQHLQRWFKSRDFYVTKFPDSPPEIFKKAVKILYQLIEYHCKFYTDKWLAKRILKGCRELHSVAVKDNFSPINRNWDYWRLVQREVERTNWLGQAKREREYFRDKKWNLEDFLNDFAGGIVRYGLFGVRSEKRIDFCSFRKGLFGKLRDKREYDEDHKTLAEVRRVIRTLLKWRLSTMGSAIKI